MIEINPYLISALSLIASLSFIMNNAMKPATRIPMVVILAYFSGIYFYISYFGVSGTLSILLVRIGLGFLFLNIILANVIWIFFLQKRTIVYGRRKDDRHDS